MQYIEQIRHHAKSRPNASAVSQQSNGQWRHLTWSQFYSQIEKFAAQLHESGLKRGDRVALMANNCIEWSVVDLACMYLGLVSVPIYPSSTTEQAKYIIDHSDARLLFAESAVEPLVKELTEQCPTLEEIIYLSSADKKQLNQEPSEQSSPNTVTSLTSWLENSAPEIPFVNCTDEDLLTIVYTSGTTGNPKGVMLTHGNLAHAMAGNRAGIPFSENERSLAVLPLSHVFERGWSYIVLHAGAHNFYVDDLNELAQQLQSVKPHAFCAVPRIFEKIHAGIFHKAKHKGGLTYGILQWADKRNKQNLQRLQAGNSLTLMQRFNQALAKKLIGTKIKQALGGDIRFMPCGGAALNSDIHGFFMGLGINVKIGYGLTETLGTVSFMPDEGYRMGTLGKPMAGVELKISEQDSEILVRSKSMTTGYFKNDEATKSLLSDGWLHTGDAGSIDEHGNLLFKERLKELMKTSGGKYIAPQRVEGIILREELFEQVAVIADGYNFASALIVPASDALKDFAQEHNIQYDKLSELLDNKFILNEVEKRLGTIQESLARYEQVKRFTLLHKAFSVDDNELTPTLKLKRRIILERYKTEINTMYA